MSAPRPIRLHAIALSALLLTAGPAAAKPGFKDLLRLLPTTQGTAQLRVIRSLGRSGKSQAVGPLLAMLDVRRDDPRRAAAIAEALGRLGRPEAIGPLLGAWDHLVSVRQEMDLTTQAQTLRQAVVEALGRLGGDGSFRTLMEALSDPEPAVVVAAIRGLSRLRERRAVDALSELAGRSGDVAQAACEALGEIGDTKGRPALERALQKEAASEQVPAAYGLALLTGAAGVRRLEAFLQGPPAGDEAGILAATYLAKLGRKPGLLYLTRLLKVPGPLQIPAAAALGKSGNPQAAAALADAASADVPLQLAIVRGLAELGGPRAAAGLKRLSEDPILSVRDAAATALADLDEN
jgi:HEAT repeat protein